MLIAVGSWGIWRAMRSFAATGHSHPHAAASFAMGTFHGIAGSSHLFGVFPALAFPTQACAILYLAGFGVGAIAGMTAFAAAMGLLSHRLGRRHSRSYSGLLYACPRPRSSSAASGWWTMKQAPGCRSRRLS